MGLSSQQARELALGLPDAVEADHHGKPSFRVAGRIFATLWTDTRMNVMLDEPGIHTAIGDHPTICTEVRWGKRLAAVAVDLALADPALLGELLADAHETKAAGPRPSQPST